MINTRLFTLFIAVLMAGCSNDGGRYTDRHDSAPSPMDASDIQDAEPRVEPKSRIGNKSPYRVNGKTYYVMDSAAGYNEVGTASWYGKKFHGYHTSNGEVYDMYKMSAAHKSLPLPTYVRVTNLDNGRSTVVRVNDRGPFHQGRIIDLSFAAATKLGIDRTGTARVRVDTVGQGSGDSNRAKMKVLQVGAFTSSHTARQVAAEVRDITGEQVSIRPVTISGNKLHRVQIDSIQSDWHAEKITKRLRRHGYEKPHLLDLQQAD